MCITLRSRSSCTVHLEGRSKKSSLFTLRPTCVRSLHVVAFAPGARRHLPAMLCVMRSISVCVCTQPNWCVAVQVLISSMASFASIVVLLVLFWMVFSIVGLHVFGGAKLDIPWPNMDSLINSMILQFHVNCVWGRGICAAGVVLGNAVVWVGRSRHSLAKHGSLI